MWLENGRPLDFSFRKAELMYLPLAVCLFQRRNVMGAVFGTACLMEVNSVVFNNSDDNQDNGNCVTHPLTINIKALWGNSF